MTPPTWLLRVHELHHAAGRPSMRKIGRLSGVSHTQVGAIFAGKHNPKPTSLVDILRQLTDDEDLIASILKDYDPYVPLDHVEFEHPGPKPPPDLNELPEWLQLLELARRDAGNPSNPIIAERAGVLPNTVWRIFNNRVTPRRETLNKIMKALEIPDATALAIRRATGAQRPVSPDALAIADAINNLADAIRTLNRGAP